MCIMHSYDYHYCLIYKAYLRIVNTRFVNTFAVHNLIACYILLIQVKFWLFYITTAIQYTERKYKLLI